MTAPLDVLLADAVGVQVEALGTGATEVDIDLDADLEPLVFVVGPKAVTSQTRLRRVKHVIDRNAPVPLPGPGTPESAAWGVSPAERYMRTRLRRQLT